MSEEEESKSPTYVTGRKRDLKRNEKVGNQINGIVKAAYESQGLRSAGESAASCSGQPMYMAQPLSKNQSLVTQANVQQSSLYTVGAKRTLTMSQASAINEMRDKGSIISDHIPQVPGSKLPKITTAIPLL